MNSEVQDLLGSHPGKVGVTVRDLVGNVLFEHNSRLVFHSASTIKVPLLVRALQKVEQGELDLSRRIELKAQDRVTGSGVLHELDPGLRLSLKDLLTLMIVVSDNTATNLVIEQLGVDDVNAFLTREGLAGTQLVGMLQLPPERLNARQRAGERNRTSARDMAELLLKLVRGELLSPTSTEMALDILKRQQLRDIIGRLLPRGAGGEPLYQVASKSGELTGVHHDVGIVWTPRPLVIAILSGGGIDPREHPDNREVALLARLAAALALTLGNVALGDILPEERGLQ